MPKIQVYISEELRAAMDDKGIESPSAICQEALEFAVADEETVAQKTKRVRRLMREIDVLAEAGGV